MFVFCAKATMTWNYSRSYLGLYINYHTHAHAHTQQPTALPEPQSNRQ